MFFTIPEQAGDKQRYARKEILVLVGHYFVWHIRVLSEVFLVVWTSGVGLQVRFRVCAIYFFIIHCTQQIHGGNARNDRFRQLP
jgi:hypothetical protein